ncbi:MAG: hypothetical protein HOC71_11005 [Candidatus Latescibacteria bacterium]|jgi:hypothetical protein|nr:hypothetical protein [Candidatus Latescibacterota bacterium]
MQNDILKITSVIIFLLLLTFGYAFAQETSPARIAFDDGSKRIDIVSGKELHNYKYAQRGSFKFFKRRLDEPEDVIHYFHDGARTAPAKNLRSMEKFQKSHAMWRLTFKTGRSNSPQYIPRIHTLAVSFIPLSDTKEAERRVYVLLDDLKLIDWSGDD